MMTDCDSADIKKSDESAIQELKHLERKLHQLFVRAFATYHLIEDDDHILVGLSGGKDSLFLLETLAKRSRISHPRFSVEALHVRMSNIHYETSTEYLERFCRNLNVPLHVAVTGFETGADTCHSSRDVRRQKSPCFLCSWYRRKQLFNTAQQLGCNKIALGHHQDDIIHTTLMNLTFQGRFSTMPALLKMKKMPLTIIRPLCMIAEADIQRYAELVGYEKQLKQCPYEHDSKRTDVHQLLKVAEQINPEVHSSIWNALNAENKLVEDY
jgi:tRNA(Ile)-lysidine synthase TilS/MesJ